MACNKVQLQRGLAASDAETAVLIIAVTPKPADQIAAFFTGLIRVLSDWGR